jgi:hypothetical protein
MTSYNPETYWSDLALRTSQQEGGIIAGDYEPYYAYKREKFLELLGR